MTSVPDYFRDHVWVPIVIGVGGASILIVLFVLIGCCCWYCCKRRRRRRNRFLSPEYRNLIRSSSVDDSDCISYGSLADSMEMKREEKTELQHEDKTTPSEETDSKPSKNERKTAKMSTKAAAAGDQSIQVEGVQTQAAGGRREMGLYEAMERQRRSKDMSDRESALLACQFHIRNDHRYTLLKTLPDLGSRMRKYWFLVDPIGAQSSPSHLLLTISPVSKQCPIRLQGTSLQTLNELIAVLKHPFLQPLSEIDLIRDKSSVIVVQPFIERGSLKDLIYKSQPVADWSVKYSVRRKGLPVETVALYGRQILEVLVLLYRRGFPPLGNLHSGNVFVDDKTCRLSGYENTLLGYKTRMYKILREHTGAVDVIMFGHLLFEMSCGYELTSLAPTPTDCQAMRCQPVMEILQFIFSNEAGNFPTIQEVLALPFFQRVKVPQLRSWDPEQLHLTTEMKVLLRAVRKGRPAAPAPAAPQPKPRKKANGAKQKYPVTPLRPPVAGRASGQSATQTTHAKFSAPPPPTGPPPPNKSAPPRPAKDRGALLGDIRRGSRLRKTVTDDRSAPRI